MNPSRLLLAAIATCMTVCATSAKDYTPDFAYPKDVAEKAEKKFKDSKNGVDRLEALMLSTYADYCIDTKSAQASAERVLAQANKEKDAGVKSLMRLFAAKIYSTVLGSTNAYSRRDLPLTPRPADIAEWSEPMFRTVIDSLSMLAWNQSTDAMSIDKFARLTTIDDGNAQFNKRYFSTQRDFAAAVIINNYFNVSDSISYVVKRQMITEHPADTPKGVYWLQYDGTGIAKYVDIYRTSTDEQTRETALYYIANWYNSNEGKYYVANHAYTAMDYDEYCAALTQAIDRHTMLEGYFMNALNMAKPTAVSFNLPASIVAGKQYRIPITCRGAKSLKTEFYSVPWSYVYSKNNNEKLVAANKPAIIHDYRLNAPEWPAATDTIDITLDEGNWLLVTSVDGERDDPGNWHPIRALSCIPVSLNGENGSTVLIANPENGAPIKGAKVTTDSGTTSTTGANGMTVVKTSKRTSLTITSGDNTVKFSDLLCLNSKKESTEAPYKVSMSTSLAAYHPGDTVRYVGVITKDGKVAKDVKKEVTLYDAGYKAIAKQELATDIYGRFSGQFAIPTDGRTGNYTLECISNNCRFTVSDFKVDEFRVDSIVAWPCTPNKDCSTVRGTVTTYSGMPLANVTVSALNDDNKATASAITASDGTFELTISTAPIINEYGTKTTGYSTYQNCQLTFTAPSGYSISNDITLNAKYRNTIECPLASNIIRANDTVAIDCRVLDAAKNPVATTVNWSLIKQDQIIDSGSAPAGKMALDWRHVTPGQYRFTVQPADSSAVAQVRYVTIYNTKTPLTPNGKAIWSPMEKIADNNGSAKLEVCIMPGTKYIYAFTNDENETIPTIEALAVEPGWFTLTVSTKYGDKVTIFTVSDCEVQRLNFTVTHDNTPDALNVEIESFRDKVTSGDKESWTLKVTNSAGKPMQSGVVLNVFNKQLDALVKYRPLDVIFTQNIAKRYQSFGFPWLNTFGVSYYKIASTDTDIYKITAPYWNTFGCECMSFQRSMRLYSISGSRNLKAMKAQSNVAMAASYDDDGSASVATAATGEECEMATDSDASSAGDNVIWRDDEQLSALWMPDLATGADGKVKVDFDAPATASTWIVCASAWTANGLSTKVTREFTTAKPVMVDSNLPRFLRQGDKTLINSTVFNNSDAARTVQVSAMIYNAADTTLLAETVQTVDIDANGSVIVPIAFDVPIGDLAAVLYRVKASVAGFADGEQGVVDILPSQSRVVEADNFYLPASQSVYATALPAAHDLDFSTVLDFTANPMATVVDALPTLYDLPYRTAIARAASYFGPAVALSLIKQHPELEIKLDKKAANIAMSTAIADLVKLQAADGGFLWSPWSAQSNVWVTGSVLQYFSWLNRNGMLPDDSRISTMLAKALKYYDDSQTGIPNLFYAEVRLGFPDITPTLTGKQTVDATVQHIVKNWKKFDIDTKAQGACILGLDKKTSTAKQILKSLTQYATITPDKGMVFKNNPDISTYAWALQAYAAVTPQADEVDALRQQLIVRKQATDWGNYPITSAVIASMINSGTPWYDASAEVKVIVDGQTIDSIKPQGTAAAIVNAPVSGSTLTIERQSGSPAYGAIVTTFTAPAAEVKAYSDGEISIAKTMFVQRDGTWALVGADTNLKVGERVKVQLTVKTERQFSYLTITDERPAAFEPADQLPGRVFVDGIFAYRENRDKATNIYIDTMPPGTWLISYEVYCGFAGDYCSGIATVTSDMAPSLTAHSSGSTISISK